MRVGVVGLGKVGLPLMLVLRYRGYHEVTGYDVDLEPARERLLDATDRDERGLGQLIAASHADLEEWGFTLTGDVDELVERSDVVLVVVPTPHRPDYGGDRPMPWQTADFDYSHLVAATRAVGDAATRLDREITLGVVSTVLPGTCRRELLPLPEPAHVRVAYCPVLISLGSVVADLLDPHFVIIGGDDELAATQVTRVFRSLHNRPVARLSLESAELAKVAHNCWTSMKIATVNALAEVAEGVGADVDQVTDTLALAGEWVPRAGLGDGGACRPRDAIAMGSLVERVDVATDVFGGLTRTRESHSAWLAGVVRGWAARTGLPVCVLGAAYKPGVSYAFGSPALLLAYHIGEPAVWDPRVPGYDEPFPHGPHVFVVGTSHPGFDELWLPEGSVLVDPWGDALPRPGVTLVRPGRSHGDERALPDA